jgi:hypothetical protein
MRRAFLLGAVLLSPLAAGAQQPPCSGEGDPFLAVPGFGAMTPMPTAEALARSRREGRELVLAGGAGEIRLADDPRCEAGEAGEPFCVRHRLVAAFADPPGYLVERGHYEHTDFLWVTRGGQVEPMADLPRLSPDGRWMLSVSASDYMRLNGIELFDLGRGDIRRAFQHLPSAGDAFSFFAFWRWGSATEATLCAWRGSPPAMTGPEPVALRRGPYGWRVEPLR